MRLYGRTSLEIVSSDVARGVRAAFVTLVPFYLAAALHRPELSWTAIGGWLGTLVDTGGPRARRARALVVFGLAGAVLIAGGEPLAPSPFQATAALALVAFLLSLLRASGGTAGALGTFLTLVAAIATGRLRTHSIRDALYFALGAGLALFVSSIVWPVWMHLPVRRAVAGVYQEIGAYMEALAQACAMGHSTDPGWTTLVREHHRRIRAAIEAGREVALAARARRMGETRFGGDVRALLGTAEAQFPLLSALAVELETLDPFARAAAGARLAALASTCHEIRRVLITPEIRKRPAIEGRPALRRRRAQRRWSTPSSIAWRAPASLRSTWSKTWGKASPHAARPAFRRRACPRLRGRRAPRPRVRAHSHLPRRKTLSDNASAWSPTRSRPALPSFIMPSGRRSQWRWLRSWASACRPPGPIGSR